MNKNNSDQNDVSGSAPGNVASALPTISIDYARYERFLADSNLSEAEKVQFLDTLWNIIVSFVDLGIGVHPLQMTYPDVDSKAENSSVRNEAVIEKKSSQKKQISQHVAEQLILEAERSQE